MLEGYTRGPSNIALAIPVIAHKSLQTNAQ